MKRSWFMVLGVAVLFAASPVIAATWTGPTLCGFSAPLTGNCGNVSQGGTITISLYQTDVSVQPSPLAGWCPSTSTYNGFYVTQLRVISPTGVEYLLGTGTSSSYKALSNTNALYVPASMNIGVPFANNPVPTTLNGEGPFSWIQGGKPSIFNPTGMTSVTGTYQVDESGYTLCGTTPSNVQFQARWFVDQKATFGVPEFPLGSVVMVAVAFAGLALVRKLSLPNQ